MLVMLMAMIFLLLQVQKIFRKQDPSRSYQKPPFLLQSAPHSSGNYGAALAKAAESELDGEVLNGGSGNSYSVNHLVSLLGGDVVFIPKRPGEPECTFADTSKISRLLGWRPGVSFEEGVHIMSECIEEWQDAPVWDEASVAEATREWFEYLGDSDKHIEMADNPEKPRDA